jgi:hypothetical protein
MFLLNLYKTAWQFLHGLYNNAWQSIAVIRFPLCFPPVSAEGGMLLQWKYKGSVTWPFILVLVTVREWCLNDSDENLKKYSNKQRFHRLQMMKPSEKTIQFSRKEWLFYILLLLENIFRLNIHFSLLWAAILTTSAVKLNSSITSCKHTEIQTNSLQKRKENQEIKIVSCYDDPMCYIIIQLK